jgi:small ligand-binding sensory domain FIST
MSSNQQDYLIRQIVGFVPSKGGVAISGTNVQVGDVIRFHVRDKTTASEDLELMVKRCQTERLLQDEASKGAPVAAIQVSCVARGRGLFGVPNVDLSNVQELMAEGKGTVGGFYANGEIGPVGLAGFSTTDNPGTFLHGFTTVVALLCDTSCSPTTKESKSALSDEQVDAWG